MAPDFEFELGTETYMAYEEICSNFRDDDNSIDDLENKDYLKNIYTIPPFKEKLFEHLRKCGFSDSESDSRAALHFLNRLCQSSGVVIERKTLSNWLKTGRVSSNEKDRRNIFKLCFALKMDTYETVQFFYKAVLESAFNYKNLYESTCFFCLNTGRRYADVERLVSEIEKMPKYLNYNPLDATEQIYSEVFSCRTEEAFMDFWTQYSVGFGEPRQTATRYIEELLEKCYKIASQYREVRPDVSMARKIRNPDALLDVIYGYRARDSYYSFSIASKNSDFPKLIRRNFPQRQNFHQIKRGKASDSVMRRTLIVLGFFCFFAGAYLDGKNSSYKLLTEFEDEINQRLLHCGFLPLYWRNPFDWMFGHCAATDDPLMSLRNLIQDLYLEKQPSDEEMF